MSDETQVIDILKETRRNLNAGKIVFALGEQKGFELERELGSGGMGVVWLARDLDVEGRVALKFLPGLVRDPVAERDLRDEVKNARDLVHENIVSVRRLHKDEVSIAVEMEYVDGPSVSRLIAESPDCWLEPSKAAPIIRGLCLAIDYAWRPPRRLVHRDVKPLNLLLNSTGVVKVVDFGIAHSVSETVARLTNVNAAKRVVGSLPYMSPQQLKGDIQHLNDVYSIGATIYELLTGTPPFRAKDIATLTSQITQDKPQAMTDRRKQLVQEKNRKVTGDLVIPKIWEETVAACLAKDPADRPQTAREIAHRLGLVAESATTPPFALRGTGESTAARRRKSGWLALAAAGVVLVGAAWFFRDRLFPGHAAEAANSAPVISRAPSSQSAAPGSNVTFTIAAAAQPDPSFQWQKNGSNLPGATLSSLTLRNVDANDVGVYSVVVSNPNGAVTTPPATLTLVQAAAQPMAASSLRQGWQLVATSPARVKITKPDGSVVFEGNLEAGSNYSLPVDQKLLVASPEGHGLALGVDGHIQPLSPVASNRWSIDVPSASTASPLISEAPPPPPEFEVQLAPLVKSGQINNLENGWLRDALSGKKGRDELALAKRLFAKENPITLDQWRARTELKFKPTAGELLSSDPTQQAHAMDLTLAPGGAVMRLIRIEPGTFVHGSPPDEVGHNPSDLSAASATITKPYFIGIDEVTQEQFESVLGARSNPSWWRGHPNWPVDQVTWSLIEDQSGFIPTLNTQLMHDFGGAVTADLPTEDEWEYACRAGQTTALYNGQDLHSTDSDPALTQIAWYGKGDEGTPERVGLLAPNAWGLYDMLGNVREWTSQNVVRGGSWKSSADECRAAARVRMNTEAAGSNTTGFRLVLRLRDTGSGN